MKTFDKDFIKKQTKVLDLADCMKLAGYKRIPQGFTSVFIHEGTGGECELNVNVEAYDGHFDKVTATESKRDAFVERVHKYLLKLFPENTIEITWYSGFNYHQFRILR